ncbi:MAG: FAD-dependent oxidoreductase, partial [Saprospiraceae bacterium]
MPLGASTRNAGFSCFGSPSEILSDIKLMGEEKAGALVRKRWAGLQKLQKRLTGSNAQYQNLGGYELYHEEEFDRIKPDINYLNDLMSDILHHPNVFSSIPVPDGIRGFSNSIHNHLEGQLHPGYMMDHLTNIFLKLGGHIRTGLNIEGIEDAGDKVFLLNSVSMPIEARKVVVATNAYAAQLINGLDMHPARNHVMVTTAVDGLMWKGSFHYNEGFYYFRNIGNRILLGGARNQDFETENTADFGTNPVIIDTLTRFLYNHLASAGHTHIEYQWSGIFAVGPEKWPIVKAVSDNVFVGVRCSGMGIALASLIGEELADLACNSDQQHNV